MARDRMVETRDAEGRRCYRLASPGCEPNSTYYYSKKAAREAIEYYAREAEAIRRQEQ